MMIYQPYATPNFVRIHSVTHVTGGADIYWRGNHANDNTRPVKTYSLQEAFERFFPKK